MRFKVLASGSKGNMTYIETSQTKVLLDAGISYSNARLKLSMDNINIDDVELIICTHEHSDHVKELVMMLKKTRACLYINQLSFDGLHPKIKEELKKYNVRFIDANYSYNFKDLKVIPLQMSHDSRNCLGFIFHSENKTLGYATDTGIINIEYLKYLKLCDGIIIEANHNVEMLQESSRPVQLIRRILSIKGHMSNQITCSILDSILSDKQKYVILAHVSEDCNSSDKIYEEIIEKLKDQYQCQFQIANQYDALDLMEL